MFLGITTLLSIGPAAAPVLLLLGSRPAPPPIVDPLTGALFPRSVASQDACVDARAADRKRILELADGTNLRARTRFQDGAWQRREGRDWVPVSGVVTGFVLESDLVSRSRLMAAEIGKSDHSARTVLAGWLLRKGLAAEALAELDTVLAAEPEHAGALALLRDREFPLEALASGLRFDQPETLAIAGAQGSSAVREALVWTLARERAHFDVQGFVAAELAAPQFRRRAFAALAARRLARGTFQKALTDRAVLDTMGLVREEAALGLRDLADANAVGPVVDALGSRFPAVRRNAAESLGNAGYAAAVGPLMANLAHLRAASGAPSGVRAHLFIGFQTAYVGDYDVEIAQGASIANPVVSTQTSGIVLDVRAQAQLSRTITLAVERREVVEALQKLTGQNDLGEDPSAWLAWWEKNRAQFEAERVLGTQGDVAATKADEAQ